MRRIKYIKRLLYVVLLFSFFGISCKKKPGANEIFIDSTNYNPVSLTVSTGTTVIWTNKEKLVHTVTSNVILFDSGDLSKGKSFSYTFTSTGTYDYHCKHHSSMKGKIIVL